MDAQKKTVDARSAVVFDVDNTLTPPRRPLEPEMAAALQHLSVPFFVCAGSDLRLIAGGKSMGGRMTSLAASEEPLSGVAGLVFLGFPLHAAGRPSSDRGDHLKDVDLPMMFVQGTRDQLADLSLLEPLIAALRPSPLLHIVEDGDHSLRVPKRTGLKEADVLHSVAEAIGSWAEGI